MSIILKGVNINSGSSQNLSVGGISQFKINYNNGTISINWTDPDNIVLDGTILSEWDNTLLVYKENTIPQSQSDGESITNNIKNKYQTDALVLNLGINKTFYLRFFTYAKNKSCNNSTDMIYKVDTSILTASSILSENTWEEIGEICNKGLAQNIWKIGDEIPLVYGNECWIHTGTSGSLDKIDAGTTLTMQIFDFNHFDKTDGSGKANMVLGCKTMFKYRFTYEEYNSGWSYGYENSDLCKSYCVDIHWNMPENLKNIIKEVYIDAVAVDGYDKVTISSIKNKVFPVSARELNVTLAKDDSGNPIIDGYQFPIFTDDNSRIRYMQTSNGELIITDLLTRTLTSRQYCLLLGYPDHMGSKGFLSATVDTSGGALCFCFNI